jgi:hypothetical protein
MRQIEIYDRLLSFALVKHFLTKRLLVVYFSGKGTTEKMAKEISDGAEGLGVLVDLKSVEECRLSDLAEADGIVVGSRARRCPQKCDASRRMPRSVDDFQRLLTKIHVFSCFQKTVSRR